MALFTDYVLEDEAGLRYSVSIVSALALIPATLVTFSGLGGTSGGDGARESAR